MYLIICIIRYRSFALDLRVYHIFNTNPQCLYVTGVLCLGKEGSGEGRQGVALLPLPGSTNSTYGVLTLNQSPATIFPGVGAIFSTSFCSTLLHLRGCLLADLWPLA